MRPITLAVALICIFAASSIADVQVTVRYSEESAEVTEDLTIGEDIHFLERARTDEDDARDDLRFTIRSRHFVFGMPRLIDDRYRIDPKNPGVSLVMKEGFVIAFLESMRSPLWVCQRWTRDELQDDQARIPSLADERDWREDPDLPFDTHIGTSYAGNDTKLDRGHMAKHSMNRAWGFDTSIQGCLMSNSTPQHRTINRSPGAWYRIEEAVEAVVGDDTSGIDVVWTISGALFRDNDNPAGEDVKADFDKLGTITSGFKVPFATFKIVCWFHENGFFHARGYVFEQPYTVGAAGMLSFAIPAQDRPLTEYIVKIRELEERAGVDFFPLLRDQIEDLVEERTFVTMWGSN